MATLINQDGTDKADSLKYDAGGSGRVFNTGAGLDTVLIAGGSITLKNKSGNDSIKITGGSGHVFTGGEGNESETLEIDGGNAVTAELGSGKDTIILTKSNGKSASGALGAIRGGDWGDVFTTAQGASGYNLYGDKGNDIFYINGGSNLLLWGGAADDTFIVKGGSNNKLFGGDSADKFEIYVASQNMTLGYGNDVVNVYEGNNQLIKGNLGINQINLLGGSLHTIEADIDKTASAKAGRDVGYGVDKVLLDGASQVTAKLGDGKDIVELRSGSGHKIYTEGWGDTVILTGSVANSLVDLGAGDDVITISGGTENTITGGEGNDSFIISGSANNTINGGAGDDSFTISGGANNTINGGAGDDSFAVTDGQEAVLNGDQGDDTYYLQGGQGHRVQESGGKNSFTISGGQGWLLEKLEGDNTLELQAGTVAKIALGAGNNSLLLGTDSTAELEQLVLGSGNNLLTLQGGSIKELEAGTGATTLELAGIENFTASLGQAADTVTITAGAKVIVDGGAGDDLLDFKGGTEVQLYGGAGNDTIYVKANADLIQGDAGDDVVELSGNTIKLLDLGSGQDSLLLENGTVETLQLSEGLDKVTAQNSTIKEILAGEGQHELELSGSLKVEKATLTAGDNHLALREGVSIESLNLGTASSTIDWYGGTIKSISVLQAAGGYAANTLNFRGLKDTTFAVTRGKFVANVLEGSNLTLNFADGEDLIKITDGTDLKINSGYGKDILEISGGSRITATGSTNNKIYISGGSDITYTCSYNGDELFVSGGKDLHLNGASQIDSFEISGGTGIEAKGAAGNDNFLISGGDEVLILGGTGSDTYRFTKLQAGGTYTVDETGSGKSDIEYFDFTSFRKQDFDIQWNGTDAVLTHSNGAVVTIKNWDTKLDLALRFANTGEMNWERLFTEQPPYSASTQAEVMQNLLTSLDISTKTGFAALDEAIYNSSMGRFNSLTKLVKEFKQLILEANINSREGALEFYKTYCGMDLDSEDTGSILGAECGGSKVLNAVDVVPEPEELTVADFVYDGSRMINAVDYNTSSIKEFHSAVADNGITFYWSEEKWESLQLSRSVLEQLVGGVVKAWAPAATNMIEQAYGFSLTQADSLLYTLPDGSRAMQLELYNSSTDGVLASVSTLDVSGEKRQLMRINAYYFQEGVSQVDGNPSIGGSMYLDRILAHELTHAVTFANMNLSTTPKFFTEGLAELTHGIDDFRNSSLIDMVKNDLIVSYTDKTKTAKNQAESLDMIFNLTNYNKLASDTMSYCGGYALLRYYTKQVMDFAMAMESEAAGAGVSLAESERELESLRVFGVE